MPLLAVAKHSTATPNYSVFAVAVSIGALLKKYNKPAIAKAHSIEI